MVPSNEEIRRKILEEAHHSKLSIHPGSNKMYHDLRHLYWWANMKQRRWLELIKNYNLEVHYHPGKANVVFDALSRKFYQVEETPLSLNHAEVLAHIALVSDLLE